MQRVEYLNSYNKCTLTPCHISRSSLAPRTVLPDNGAFYNANTSRCTSLNRRESGSSLRKVRNQSGKRHLHSPQRRSLGFLRDGCDVSLLNRSGCIAACETRYWRPLPLPHVCSPASLGRIPRGRCAQNQTQLSGLPNATWR